MTTRAARRAHLREHAGEEGEQRQRAEVLAKRRAALPRIVAFIAIAVVILGAGAYLAGSVFLGQRSSSSAAGYLPVRLSMAGFDPKVIDARAGSTVKLDFWNTDNAMHLDGGGVHTFIMDSQSIYVKIPAEARQQYAFTAPSTPGDYDFYCNTCCGGKESPTMHGTLRVTA
ncbi:MAG: cupredoxin domain-containing protein [Chloroflexi bacterium]|nr:cupredoxin domain-containing protein [Chloroflexota bacterium]